MSYILDPIANATGDLTRKLTPKDFQGSMKARWCAGCGNYSIMASLQRVLPTIGIAKEKIMIIAGIGCSSRLPYYMNNYGLHTIHGRPLAIATGLKFSRPDLSIWVATGDGDCVSIGGNHFIHACRRNVDLNVMMFNNQIYSLTKGQYSPTSQRGQITKSSPFGVVDNPFNPVGLALGAGASFVARAFDIDVKRLTEIMSRASKHVGMSFIEIYTNCVIFNDGAFNLMRDRATTEDYTVQLEDGKPLVFGKDKDKAIKLDGFTPVVFNINEGNNSINDALVHNEKDSTLAFILSHMTYNPNVPRPLGIFQDVDYPVYNDEAVEQIENIEAKYENNDDLTPLLRGNDFWEVK